MIHENYHTHTFRCKHAKGDIADYCVAALEKGIEILAFTDHTPTPDNWHNEVRMDLDELHDYCEKIEQARIDFPTIKIIKGIECEYRPEVLDFYKDTLIGEYGIEMLVGGIHFFPFKGESLGMFGIEMTLEMLDVYEQIAVSTIESGLFSFFAHPDLFASIYRKWDENAIRVSKRILAAAQESNMPLEINGYGVVKGLVDTPDGKRWGYPIEKFWELAANYDIEVVVNSDAHYPSKIVGGMSECYEIAKKYGLKLANMQDRLGL